MPANAGGAPLGLSVQTATQESRWHVKPEVVPGPVRSRVKYPDFWSTCLTSFNRFTIHPLVFFFLLLVLVILATLLGVELNALIERANLRYAGPVVGPGLGPGVTGFIDVKIGSTWDAQTNYKCVPVADNVHCDKSAEQIGRTGEFPDTFDIYRMGGKMCARRTDHTDPWGIDLVLRCKLVGHSDAAASEEKTYTQIDIGSSLHEHSSTKCVSAPENVFCSNEAEQIGRTGEYPDRFEIYHEAGGKICAHRTDSNHEWGLDLKLKCEVVDASNLVVIGDSLDKSTKCVADPGNVHCDNHAEHMGRSGKFPDTFDIFHEDGKICAHRTDHDDPWGLHLVLKCKPKPIVA